MRPVIISAIAIGASLFTACGESQVGDAQSSPRKLAEAIFHAARSGNTGGLADLVDVDADIDAKLVAQAASDEGVREEFVRYFAKSQLKNEPVIDGEKATVDILFGPDGDKEETLEMVKKNGKWYLLSF